MSPLTAGPDDLPGYEAREGYPMLGTLRALGCVATALTLLLGLAGPAQANVKRFRDANNDTGTSNDIRWVRVNNA